MGFFTAAVKEKNARSVIMPLQYALAAFALTAAQVGGQYAPWGLGFLAAAGRGFHGLCALGGIAAGAFCFFDFQEGLRYIAAALLIYCANLTFCDSKLYRRHWFRPLAAGMIFLAVQSVYFWGRRFSVWLLGLSSAAATILSAMLAQRFLCRSTPRQGSAAEKEAPSVLDRPAAAFRSLYESLFRPAAATAPENPAVIFDRAAEKVCRTCQKREQCWHSEYNATYNAFNDACGAFLNRKIAESRDFPSYFVEKCAHFPALLNEINRELQAYLLRRQYRLRLQTTRELAAAQYAQMGEVLSSVHTAAPAANFRTVTYQVGFALRPKEGESVCGDQISAFSFGASAYFLLSDGMGSGEAAHAESAMTVRLLQQFLTAGIDPMPALKTLNTAMTLRAEQGGGFTTIDLAVLDQVSGDAALYKYGASPTYIKQGGRVKRLTGNALPPGLEAGSPAPAIKVHLPHGSWLIMTSDGVAGTGGDEWLMDLLAGFSGDDPRSLCAHVMAASRAHGGLADDCAVLVVRVENALQSREKEV